MGRTPRHRLGCRVGTPRRVCAGTPNDSKIAYNHRVEVAATRGCGGVQRNGGGMSSRGARRWNRGLAADCQCALAGAGDGDPRAVLVGLVGVEGGVCQFSHSRVAISMKSHQLSVLHAWRVCPRLIFGHVRILRCVWLCLCS